MRAAMAGQQFQYDDSGNTFFYFLTSFVALIVIPATYYLWPRDQHVGKCPAPPPCSSRRFPSGRQARGLGLPPPCSLSSSRASRRGGAGVPLPASPFPASLFPTERSGPSLPLVLVLLLCPSRWEISGRRSSGLAWSNNPAGLPPTLCAVEAVGLVLPGALVNSASGSHVK